MLKAWRINFMWSPQGKPKEFQMLVLAHSWLRARRGLLGRCRGSRITRMVRDFNADAASQGALVVEKGAANE